MNIFNSYAVSIGFAMGNWIANYLCFWLGLFDFTSQRAFLQSVIVTILFLSITTVGKIAIGICRNDSGYRS